MELVDCPAAAGFVDSSGKIGSVHSFICEQNVTFCFAFESFETARVSFIPIVCERDRYHLPLVANARRLVKSDFPRRISSLNLHQYPADLTAGVAVAVPVVFVPR